MSNISDGQKLLVSYNVRPSEGRAYYEFVLGRYIPALQALGLEVSEAWHTAYGNYPNRLIGFVSHDEATMIKVLNDENWDALNEQLGEYVTEFSYKVIPYQLGFQF